MTSSESASTSLLNIGKRALSILTRPAATWRSIALLKPTVLSSVVFYALPFIILGAISSVISFTIIGKPFYSGDFLLGWLKTPLRSTLLFTFTSSVCQLLGIFIAALIAMKVAKLFENHSDHKDEKATSWTASVNLVVYSLTPSFIANLFCFGPWMKFCAGLLVIWSLALFVKGSSIVFGISKKARLPFSIITFATVLATATIAGWVLTWSQPLPEL